MYINFNPKIKYLWSNTANSNHTQRHHYCNTFECEFDQSREDLMQLLSNNI